MGYYNSKQFTERLDEFLRGNICPITKKPMKPCDVNYKSGYSSFHYVCEAIDPSVKIALSGSLISNEDKLYDELKNNATLQKEIIEKIRKHKGEEFMIATYTIREILEGKKEEA
ncbi:hypothetical protein Fleli_0756 [Bernardetia litoralis DSM 6794]|uniref:Uncharacterized protein n=1 Tax=Bernardetia litoralis (strain ATCC 23117 / DSM 6794 / NBRC 15988 / NCIMB 1366 / Fx l1 / Sio-4) TaxID=880071 RepID=I4AGY1_BERLS|nr:hypothetical protein [Bernardetia litoralis]AFM03216.1 hypothetical protein Fleli_0756 [Bernardetia litoralis DSM 6794]